MPEIQPTPSPVIEIGATPLYVTAKTPVIMKFGLAPTSISKIDLHAMHFDEKNPQPGLDKAVILMKNTDPATPYKPLKNIDVGGTVNWNDIYGVMLTDDAGDTKVIEQKDLSLTPPAPEFASAPVPEPAPPPAALTNLENRATSISLIGLDVDQMIQAQAGRDMEQIAAEGGNWFQRLTRGIWKGNIAHELLEEHSYQFRKKQVDAAHMMLSDETFSTIESRADTAYTEAMNKKTKLGQAWTRFKDAVARNIGGYTTKETLAIAQAGEMYAAGELSNIQEYENNLHAVRTRFEQDFLDADGVIRKNLGERLEILKSGDPKHKEIVDGIKDLVHKYVNGDQGYASKRELEAAMAEFAKKQGIGADPKTAKEAQLYASSLYHISNEAKARITSGEAMTSIDAQLDAMEVRIGRAQMGEATQFEKSATRKAVEWMMQKNIVGTLFANEASAGTAVAAALSLVVLPRMTASRLARVAGGAVGGGAVAGAVTGLKENARMKREFFQFMRQRETGAGLPQPGDKLRTWMAAREIPQVEAGKLMSRYTATAYKDGKFNADLSEDDLTKTLAYLADAKARRALSARGGENISLIRWGPAVDVERTNLDRSIDKLERDLQAKFGQTISNRTKLLTDAQTKVLAQGRNAASLSDPLKVALGAVSDNDIVVEKFRNKFLFGKEETRGDIQGLDAALKDIKTQIRLEATRRGIKAGAIGAAIGTALTESGNLIAHHDEVWQNIQHVLHIGPQVTTELPAALHLADVPTLAHFTDAQGIDHAIQASLPEHTSLIADPATHTFTLMGADNHELVHGITIDAHGQIANADALNASRDAIEHGLHFDNAASIIPGHPGIPGVPGVPATGGEGTFDMHAPEGEWNWSLHHLQEAGIQHQMPADNFQKNLFRVWTDSQHIPITQTEYHNVPTLFAPENQVAMGHAIDHALNYRDQIGATPTWHDMMAQIEHAAAADPTNTTDPHALALMYKIGVVDQPATQADFDYIATHLGGGPGIPGIPGVPEVPSETLYTGVINQTLTSVTTNVPPLVDFSAVAAVAPRPREGLKPGKAGEPTPFPEPPKPEPAKPQIEDKDKDKDKDKKSTTAGPEVKTGTSVPSDIEDVAARLRSTLFEEEQRKKTKQTESDEEGAEPSEKSSPSGASVTDTTTPQPATNVPQNIQQAASAAAGQTSEANPTTSETQPTINKNTPRKQPLL